MTLQSYDEYYEKAEIDWLIKFASLLGIDLSKNSALAIIKVARTRAALGLSVNPEEIILTAAGYK